MNSPILFLLTSGGLGGAERVALDAMKALSKEKIHVILPNPGPITMELDKHGFEYTIISYPIFFKRLSNSSGINLFQLLLGIAAFKIYFLKLLYFIFKTPVCSIYSHGLKAHGISSVLGILIRKPVIWHMHLFPPTGLIGKIFRILAKSPKTIIANSAAVQNACAQFRSDTETVYCAIDGRNYKKISPENIPESIRFQRSGTIAVGMVTVLAPWKGVELFIETLIPILLKNENLNVIICGDEIYETSGHDGYLMKLISIVESNNLTDRFKFIAFQSDVSPIYSQLDFLVHASLRPEPFGRIVSEARLCGCPVIAVDSGGSAEQIIHGETGLLYSSEDRALLESAIITLLDDRALRKKLAVKGRDWVGTNLSMEKFENKFRSILLN